MKRRLEEVDEIIVHCSATPAGRDFTAAEIDRWHRERGFREIGYHYIVRLDGTVESGRPLREIGAHCRGHNANSIGICYIGGLGADGRPCDTRTKAQKEALARLIWRLSLDWVQNRRGLLKVRSHHDYNKNKACPCFNARKEYDGQ